MSLAFRRCSWRTSSGSTPPFISASTSNGISSSSTKRRTFSCQARALGGRGWGMALRHRGVGGRDRTRRRCFRLAGDRDRRAHHVVELAQAGLLFRQVAEAIGAGGEAGLHRFNQALVLALHLAVDAAGEPARRAERTVA